MRTSLGRVITLAMVQRSSAVAQRAAVMFLDMDARLVHQPLIIDAGGTGGLAVQAGEAAVDVIDLLFGRRAALLQHVLHQHDAAARAVALIAQQHIGRTGRGADAAMDASAHRRGGGAELRIGKLFGGEDYILIRAVPD